MSNPDAPENKDPEAFGMTLFKEDQQGWSDVFAINNHSIFFVFLAGATGIFPLYPNPSSHGQT